MSAYDYELILTQAGACILQMDDEVLWSSDDDEDFQEEFGEVIASDDLNDVGAWLVDEGYLPPRVPLLITDETIDAPEESGWFKGLGGDNGDDDDDDGDEEFTDDDEDDEP
jgi:hypothetical protein